MSVCVPHGVWAISHAVGAMEWILNSGNDGNILFVAFKILLYIEVIINNYGNFGYFVMCSDIRYME